MARLVRDSLRQRGYNVFMDVEDLRSGLFNTALFSVIDSASDVVVVLTPGSLDHCRQEGDWVRLEVAHAIQMKKNIIPVMTRGFQWPIEPLPADLAPLPNYNGIAPSHEYFEESMKRLAEFLVGRPKSRVQWLTFLIGTIVLVAVSAAVWIAELEKLSQNRPSPVGVGQASQSPLPAPAVNASAAAMGAAKPALPASNVVVASVPPISIAPTTQTTRQTSVVSILAPVVATERRAPPAPNVVIASALPANITPITQMPAQIQNVSTPVRAADIDRADHLFGSRDYVGAFSTYARLSDADLANIQLHRHVEECARRGHLEKPFLDRYTALVQRQPTNSIFHNYLGNACLMLDRADKDGRAREHYEAALRLNPTLALPLANLGILSYRSGKTNEAESLFQRYLAAYPDDAQGWVNLGLVYATKFDANTNDTTLSHQAEQAFRKALQNDNGSASAYKGLGRIYAASGRKADALYAYQRSLALDYDQPSVRQQIELLAWESANSRNPALQLDDLKTRAIKGDATEAPPVVTAMRFLGQQRFQEAEQVCLKWTRHEPENPLAYRLLGRAYQGLGQTTEAEKAFEQASRLSDAAGK